MTTWGTASAHIWNRVPPWVLPTWEEQQPSCPMLPWKGWTKRGGLQMPPTSDPQNQNQQPFHILAFQTHKISYIHKQAKP